MTSANRSWWQRRLPSPVLWCLAVVCGLAAPLAYALLDKPVFDWQARRGFAEFSLVGIEAFRLLGKAWLLVWLLLAWVAITGRWRRVFVALLALLILALPLNATKLLTGRPRPREKMVAMETSRETTDLRGLSFPSGDTASAFTVAAALGVSLAWPWAVGALVIAGGVGAMRVVDLAHHPSDILAGAALGILAALVASRVAHRWPPPAIEFWGRPVAAVATVAIPAVVIFTHGRGIFLLLLRSYFPLVVAVYLVVSVRRRLTSLR